MTNTKISNKVFISGSISLKTLRKDDIAALEQIIKDNSTILIGDAYGVDRAVQQILAERGYKSVIVYFSGANPRNNIGNWQTRQISNPNNLTGKSRYQLKDRAMGADCNSGIMFWDGYSKGTKQNMDCLDTLVKPYIVNKPNASVSVSLSPKMRLKQALKDAGIKNPATVTKLTISDGTLIGEDSASLKKNRNHCVCQM